MVIQDAHIIHVEKSVNLLQPISITYALHALYWSVTAKGWITSIWSMFKTIVHFSSRPC